MPSPYTGNPVGTGYSPDIGPGSGRKPTILIPSDGDDNEQGLWAQPFKTLADHVAFIVSNMSAFAPAYFGDGSDGSLDVSGALSVLGAVKNYTDLTVESTGIFMPRRSIIRVSGTLTVNGLIHVNGAPGGNATVGGGSFSHGGVGGQGTDGVGGSILGPCPVGGGTSGGSGGTDLITYAPGSAGLPDTNGVIVGVPGGPSTGGAPFAATTATTGLRQSAEIAYAGRSARGGDGGSGVQQGTANDAISPDLLTLSLLMPGFVARMRYADHGADVGSFAELLPLRGGIGGNGGVDSHTLIRPGEAVQIPGTGGAGAGADCVLIYARNVVLGSTQCIQAKGGNGGNGTTVTLANGAPWYTNGGSGGGAGRILVFHGGLTGSLDADVVSGGLGGHGVFGTSATTRQAAGENGSITIMKIA